MLSTTELLVEHIISGILSLIWILAIVFCFTGFDQSVLPVIKDSWGLFAVVTTAIAYPLGIFLDTIADKLLAGRTAAIKLNYGLKEDFSLLFLVNAMKDENIRSYFTYNRFKNRVARSSFLNFLMIAFSGPALLLSRGSEIGSAHPARLSLVIFIVFAILSVTAILLWRDITNTTYKRAGDLWKRRGELV